MLTVRVWAIVTSRAVLLAVGAWETVTVWRDCDPRIQELWPRRDLASQVLRRRGRVVFRARRRREEEDEGDRELREHGTIEAICLEAVD